MGSGSKFCSVILRFSELASAAIVAGILGRYLAILADANIDAGSRIIYSEVIAGISLLFSIVLFPPLKYSFYCFPIDFALFICWIVAFALLCNLTGSRGCEAYWYWNYWGYYWGRYWYTVPLTAVTQSLVGTAGCAQWRTTLAFSFIGGCCWLLSACLGVYVCTKSHGDRSSDSERGIVSVSTRVSRLRRKLKPSAKGIPTKDTAESTISNPVGNQA